MELTLQNYKNNNLYPYIAQYDWDHMVDGKEVNEHFLAFAMSKSAFRGSHWTTLWKKEETP